MGIWSFILFLAGLGFKLSGWESIYGAYICWAFSAFLGLIALKQYWGKLEQQSAQQSEHIETPNKKAIETPKKKKNLLELFRSDFPNTFRLSTEYNLKINNLPVTFYATLYGDPGGRSKFLGFYIKLSPVSYEVCQYLSKNYKGILEHMDSQIEFKGGHIAEIGFTSWKELVFSKRVYIYHEDIFTLQQLAEIEREYQSNGLSVIFRGLSYAYLQG